MELQRYSDAHEFLGRAEGFLLEHEAEHGLILAIITDLPREGWVGHPLYLAIVEDGPEVVLAAVRTPERLVLSRCGSPLALDLLLGDLGPSLGSLGGAHGPSEVSTAFAEGWRAATGGRVELRMAQRIFVLEQVAPTVRAEGQLRRIGAADRDLVVDRRLDFERSALGGTRADAEEAFDRFLNADPQAEGLYLWEVDARPVSMVGYRGPTPNGIRIGSVYTPPTLRRRGYASAAVAALSQHLLDSGRRFCFLYTDLANPTSNHVYQAIGYRPVADSSLYRFDP